MKKQSLNMIDLSNSKARNTTIVAACVCILYFTISLMHIGKKAGDETVYHYPNVLNFSKNGVSAIFNSKYSAANTPLPYIIIAGTGKLFGTSVTLARSITCLFSFFSFLLILQIFINLKLPGWYALCVLFYPYFFVNSFVFYVMNYGVFFMSAAFLILVKGKNNYINSLLIGICLSLATLCQQFYMVVPIAIVTSYFIVLYRDKNLSVQSFSKLVLNAVLMMLPFILPILLFLKWGGLTHPNFEKHSLSFYPSTIVAILFITGIYSIPFLLQARRKHNILLLLITLFFSIAIVWFFRPIFNNKQGAGMFTGLTFHLTDMLGRIASFIPIITLTLFTWLGTLTIFYLAKAAQSAWDYGLVLSWLILGLVYSTNTLIGERHILPSMIIFFLAMLPRITQPLARKYTVALALIGTSYFFYWNFVKFGPVQ